MKVSDLFGLSDHALQLRLQVVLRLRQVSNGRLHSLCVGAELTGDVCTAAHTDSVSRVKQRAR